MGVPRAPSSPSWTRNGVKVFTVVPERGSRHPRSDGASAADGGPVGAPRGSERPRRPRGASQHCCHVCDCLIAATVSLAWPCHRRTGTEARIIQTRKATALACVRQPLPVDRTEYLATSEIRDGDKGRIICKKATPKLLSETGGNRLRTTPVGR